MRWKSYKGGEKHLKSPKIYVNQDSWQALKNTQIVLFLAATLVKQYEKI